MNSGVGLWSDVSDAGGRSVTLSLSPPPTFPFGERYGEESDEKGGGWRLGGGGGLSLSFLPSCPPWRWGWGSEVGPPPPTLLKRVKFSEEVESDCFPSPDRSSFPWDPFFP